jgi:hypothetical protein
MKTILLIFVLSCIYIYAQDIEPTQQSFTFDSCGQTLSNYLINGNSGYFKQENFILGWSMGGGKKMSIALSDNQAEAVMPSFYPPLSINSGSSLCIKTDGFYDAGGNIYPTNSEAMWYAPYLKITNPGSMNNVRPSDPRYLIDLKIC